MRADQITTISYPSKMATITINNCSGVVINQGLPHIADSSPPPAKKMPNLPDVVPAEQNSCAPPRQRRFLHPFVCESCGNDYMVKGSLVRHQKRYCGREQGEFVCPYCGKHFFQKYNLQTHIKSTTCMN